MKNTPLQFLLALNDRIPHADTRSPTSWPAPPVYRQPLVLETTDLTSLFRDDLPFDFCFDLWSAYGMLINSAIESYVTQVVCKGSTEPCDILAQHILLAAHTDYPNTFAETYDRLVLQHGELMEIFINDITLERWDPRSGSTKGIVRNEGVAYFLQLETQFGVRSSIYAYFSCSHMYGRPQISSTCPQTLFVGTHSGSVVYSLPAA